MSLHFLIHFKEPEQVLFHEIFFQAFPSCYQVGNQNSSSYELVGSPSGRAVRRNQITNLNFENQWKI
jgi:hypothetical protein